jgi:hypothetical protein
MSKRLKGKWHYHSFRNSIEVKDGKIGKDTQLAIPWASHGKLDGNTDEAGEVTGTLMSPTGLPFKITGHITPAAGKLPASVEFIAETTVEGRLTVYRMKGFFIPGSDHVVGTVLSVENDLANQPVGTAGAFVLFPAKA